MNNDECVTKIFEKLQEIVNIYREYNPEGQYLTLSWISHDLESRLCNPDSYFINNRYYGEDKEHPINFYGHIEKSYLYD